jgi:hypothetical protein
LCVITSFFFVVSVYECAFGVCVKDGDVELN